jgi:hypothetical protein
MLKAIPVVVIASFCCSCGKKELDRETAMKLLQGRVVRQVTFFLSDLAGTSESVAAFRELEKAGLAVCGAPMGGGLRLCQFTSTSGVATDFSGVHNFSAGVVVASAVTGVLQTGPNSATAEVQLSFQAAPLYAQHRAAFDSLEGSEQVSVLTQPRATQATFQLFDNGWRLQAIQ